MADFKVTENLDAEISDFYASGFNLNTSPKYVPEITKMKTAAEYHRQHEAIKALLELYAKLIVKDANDLQKMVEETRRLDEALCSKVSS